MIKLFVISMVICFISLFVALSFSPVLVEAKSK